VRVYLFNLLSWSMYSFICLFFILPNCYMSALSGRRDNNSTENIRNPIRGTGTVVDMHGASSGTLHIIASNVNITIYMHSFISICTSTWIYPLYSLGRHTYYGDSFLKYLQSTCIKIQRLGWGTPCKKNEKIRSLI
jgi:hypothetical protein